MAVEGSGVFPPEAQGGVPPSPIVCNGYRPLHSVTGVGPFYIAPDCTTTLTDCQLNALSSEILAAVDLLGYPYNSNLIDNLGRALVDKFGLQQIDIDSRVKREGDTMEGPLNVVCPPINDNEATCKLYVDQAAQAAADACCAHMQQQLDDAAAGLQQDINNRVRRDGDQMTGPLILSGDPTANMQAATKQYVDNMIGGVIVAPEAPVGIAPSRLWWDSLHGGLYVNFDDGNSLQWVQACSECTIGAGGVIVGPVPPTGVPDNTLWFDSVGGRLYIRFNDGDSSQWVTTQPGGTIGGGPGGNFLPITGGTLTGDLILNADPTIALQAATKSYVDSQIALGGTFVDAPADGQLWARKDHSWALVPEGGGGIEDAPADDQIYARQNNAWVLAPTMGPIDGGLY